MDIEEWIKLNFKDKVNNETYIEVLYFPIIWHIFEKEITDTKYSTQKALRKIENKIDVLILQNIFINVKDYINNKFDIEYAYYSFHFRENDISLDKFLKLFNTTLIEEKLEFLLWISYRVRNNMFHGIKEISELDYQLNLFKNLNQFLIACIESNK